MVQKDLSWGQWALFQEPEPMYYLFCQDLFQIYTNTVLLFYSTNEELHTQSKWLAQCQRPSWQLWGHSLVL